MKIFHVICAAFCVTVFSAYAQKEADPFGAPDGSEKNEIPKLIRSQVEYVEMSHKDLTRLMMEDKGPTADATALRMKVQAMVDKDEAKVIDTQVAIGKPGQKQAIESVNEFMFPTEYEFDLSGCFPNEKSDGEESVPENKLPADLAFPYAFETKNLGSTLESDPTIGADGRFIDLRLLSEFVWHTGDKVWSERKDVLGNVSRVTMPDFYKVTLKTSIACISGQYVVAGVLSPRDAKGEVDPERKVMVFVKCDVLEVK